MAKKLSLKHKIIALCALVLVAGGACAVYLALKPNVPSERKMARIMADIYMADAVLQEHTTRGPKDKTIENTYHTILTHYEITKTQYDSAVAWYSRHPQKMSSVYERAIAILSQREEIVKSVAAHADSVTKAIDAINDSLTTTFQLPKTVILPLVDKNDTIKKFLKPNAKKYDRLTFDVDLDSLVGGHLDLRQRYTVTKSIEPTPKAYARIIITYADTTETSDSVRLEAFKRVTQRVSELSAKLKDSIPAVKAQISLFDAKGLKDMSVTMREIKVSYKPYDVVDTTNYDNLLPSLFAY